MWWSKPSDLHALKAIWSRWLFQVRLVESKTLRSRWEFSFTIVGNNRKAFCDYIPSVSVAKVENNRHMILKHIVENYIRLVCSVSFSRVEVTHM